MDNIIITGSKGFIGQNLKNQINDFFNISEINEDIFDNNNWEGVLKNLLNDINPKVIFHVGACSDTLELNTNYMMKLNFQFTKHIVDWSVKNDCKLIYSSSAANYGINGQYPSNLYGWSKYVAEQYVITNNGIALRYFNVYGPNEEHKGRMASVAYNSFQKYVNGEQVKLFPGNPKRDFIYIKDVVHANVFAYNNYEQLNKKYYDVGFGEARYFEDVLNIMQIPFDYCDYDEIPIGYQFFTCCDKNNWMPGWKPNYDLESGLEYYLKYLIEKNKKGSN